MNSSAHGNRIFFCVLAVAFILQSVIVPYCFAEPIVIEVPGYAKAVIGSYGTKC